MYRADRAHAWTAIIAISLVLLFAGNAQGAGEVQPGDILYTAGYHADYLGYRIEGLHPHSLASYRAGDGIWGPMLKISPTGEAIVAGRDPSYAVLMRVDLETGEGSLIPLDQDILGTIQGLAIADDGIIYLATSLSSDDDIWRINPTTGQVESLVHNVWCPRNYCASMVASIAIDGEGRIVAALDRYYSDGVERIVRVDPDTRVVELILTEDLGGITGIAVDEDGTLLALAEAEIIRVNPETGDYTTVMEDGLLYNRTFTSKQDISISETGKIYVSNWDGRIVEYDPATGIERLMTTRANSAAGIAVVPGLPPPPACSDGIDNDGDLRRDYPFDLGCTGPHDGTEEPTCSDGMDNDADDLIDMDDPGCESPEPLSEESPQCSDGIDNDGDGYFDHPDDPECLTPADKTEHWAPRFSHHEPPPYCGLLGIEVMLVPALARTLASIRRRRRLSR